MDKKRSSPWQRSTSTKQTPQTAATLYDYAISLLARREYSVAELYDRLARRTDEQSLMDHTIYDLQQQGLQSDIRFAEVFARSRVSRRHGPRRIANELKLKGIDTALAQEAIQALDVDWYALACEALAARFSSPGKDLRERVRQQRFMAGRGFDSDQMRYALSSAWMSETDD